MNILNLNFLKYYIMPQQIRMIIPNRIVVRKINSISGENIVHNNNVPNMIKNNSVCYGNMNKLFRTKTASGG